jgi:hypothetical protein
VRPTSCHEGHLRAILARIGPAAAADPGNHMPKGVVLRQRLVRGAEREDTQLPADRLIRSDHSLVPHDGKLLVAPSPTAKGSAEIGGALFRWSTVRRAPPIQSA